MASLLQVIFIDVPTCNRITPIMCLFSTTVMKRWWTKKFILEIQHDEKTPKSRIFGRHHLWCRQQKGGLTTIIPRLKKCRCDSSQVINEWCATMLNFTLLLVNCNSLFSDDQQNPILIYESSLRRLMEVFRKETDRVPELRLLVANNELARV